MRERLSLGPIGVLIAAIGIATLPGCGRMGGSWDLDESETSGTTTSGEPPSIPATCPPEACVDTAPATYTGPSEFWRGKVGQAPDCADPTPLQGVEGLLVDPTDLIQFVRECRITPSDTCATEGKVCVPPPEEGSHTCVHHDDDAPCPPEYDVYRDVVMGIEDGIPFLFTLCCRESPRAT